MARIRSGVLVGWDIATCFWVIKKKKNAGPFVVHGRWSITGRNFLASFDSFCLLLLFAPGVQGRGLNSASASSVIGPNAATSPASKAHR